jgi:2-polyprenyl-3-methyl-5-hydroxy-6-metoxy-1,4-benzoquinol methylase
MMSLRTRSAELEIMDDLDCHGEVVDQTLRELEIINRLLGGDNVTIDGIGRLLNASDAEGNAITIADYGCGGGDLAIKIIQWAKRKNYNLNVVGIDANPHIISFAKENCKDFKEISFKTMDVFSNETTYDIITATLFVHHFDNEQLASLFKSMKAHSRLGVVINDIHRHSLSYHSIKWLTQLFSKSAMVKFDAPLSVRRAFKRGELVYILKMAGINNYKIRWKWAFRYQLIILA